MSVPPVVLPFPTPGPHLAEQLDSPPAIPTPAVALARRRQLAEILLGREPVFVKVQRIEALFGSPSARECADTVLRLYVDEADFEK